MIINQPKRNSHEIFFRAIAAINHALKRNDLPEDKKKDMQNLRETLEEMIRRLAE